jgi:hypothetical protein
VITSEGLNRACLIEMVVFRVQSLFELTNSKPTKVVLSFTIAGATRSEAQST